MNLVLDEVEESLRGMCALKPPHLHPPLDRGERRRGVWLTRESDDEGNESTRELGLVVVRGTLLVVISPVNGSEVIENPFLQPSDD